MTGNFRIHTLRKAVLLIAVFFAVTFSGNALRAQRSTRPPSAANVTETIQHGGISRSYDLHLPPAAGAGAKLPLVLVLHGGGGNSQNAARMSGFTPVADREGFLVAYPNGTGFFGDRLLTWNSGNCCAYAARNKIDDTGFLSALIDKLIAERNVDPKRVYVTGMSNGGMMSYRAGCELAGKVAAIAPVAGALNVEPCRPSEPVSVIAIHGLEDKHVRYEGGKPIIQADRAPRVDKSVAFARDFWKQANGCPGSAIREVNGNVTSELLSDCRNSTAVTILSIAGEGHTWPGGRRGSPRGDAPSTEFSATEAIWKFFRDHPKK